MKQKIYTVELGVVVGRVVEVVVPLVDGTVVDGTDVVTFGGPVVTSGLGDTVVLGFKVVGLDGIAVVVSVGSTGSATFPFSASVSNKIQSTHITMLKYEIILNLIKR